MSVPDVRIAVRGEGEWVNAYLARGDTMEGAQLVASIRRAVCDRRPELFDRWKAILHDTMMALCEDTGVPVLRTEEQTAPEHERAGHA